MRRGLHLVYTSTPQLSINLETWPGAKFSLPILWKLQLIPIPRGISHTLQFQGAGRLSSACTETGVPPASFTHSFLTAAEKRQSAGEVTLPSLMRVCAHMVEVYCTSRDKGGLMCVHSPSHYKEHFVWMNSFCFLLSRQLTANVNWCHRGRTVLPFAEVHKVPVCPFLQPDKIGSTGLSAIPPSFLFSQNR